MLTNQLPLVYRLVRTERFCGRVAFFQRELKCGFKHDKYPITLSDQDLVEQGGGKLRAFDYRVNCYNSTYECHIAGTAQRVEGYYSGKQSYKLQIVLQTVNNHREGLGLNLEALRSAFTPHQLIAMKNGLSGLIIALDWQPNARLGDLETYPAPHVTLACGSLKSLFTSQFVTQVVGHGNRTALIGNKQSLTCRQLGNAAEQIVRYLCQQGIGRGQVVGIIAKHNAQTVMVVYGTLRRGAAFLLLSPALSTTRLYAMCRKAQVAYILYDLVMHGLTQALTFSASSLLQALVTSTLARGPWPVIEPQDLVYVLFTSGLTDEPKDVRVFHSDPADYFHFVAKRYFTAQDRAALYSSLSFDLTTAMLLAPLCVDISTSVRWYVESETLLRMAVVDQPNTMIKLTPAHLRLLCAAGISSEQIRALMIGGKDFKRDLVHRVAVPFPQAVICNEYGPTRATIGCMIYRYAGQETLPSLPIGMAIDGCQATTCSPWGYPVPGGETGELVVYGASVMQGYIDALQQTIVAHLKDTNGVMIGYRSSDTGYAIIPNMLVYQGRKDDQVKVNGYRIELCEIERALLSAPQVEGTAVAVIDDVQGQHSELPACVTPSFADVATVIQHLRQ